VNLKHYPNREAWLAARRVDFGIGGSDTGKILGVAPPSWGGPYSVYADRVLGQQQKRSADEQSDLTRGQRWEPMALAEYTEETGADVSAYDYALVEHPTESWARASPDAFVFRPDRVEPIGGLEAKTDQRGAMRWGPTGTAIGHWDSATCGEFLPQHVATQVYWYLECTGLPWWDIAALVPSWAFPELRIIRLMRDPITQGRILDKVGAWRERHLVRGVMPPPDSSDSCSRVLQQTWTPDPAKRLHDATDEEAELATSLYHLREEKRENELARSHTKASLAWLLKERYGLRLSSGAKVTWGGKDGRRVFRLKGFN
jgi:predicted phage-related endonuclease